MVYIGASNSMYALDVTSGAIIWRKILAGALAPSPVAANRVVYIGSGASLLAFDGATGDILWKGVTASTVEAPPIVVNGVVLVSANNDLLYAFALPVPPAAIARPDPAQLHTTVR